MDNRLDGLGRRLLYFDVFKMGFINMKFESVEVLHYSFLHNPGVSRAVVLPELGLDTTDVTLHNDSIGLFYLQT
jgi:hypothetical protein